MQSDVATRPKLVKVDSEMQRLCGLLEDEVSAWPEVSARAMFGMRAFYRGRAIFAARPRTRAMGTPSAILLKLPTTRGERAATPSRATDAKGEPSALSCASTGA